MSVHLLCRALGTAKISQRSMFCLCGQQVIQTAISCITEMKIMTCKVNLYPPYLMSDIRTVRTKPVTSNNAILQRKCLLLPFTQSSERQQFQSCASGKSSVRLSQRTQGNASIIHRTEKAIRMFIEGKAKPPLTWCFLANRQSQ